MTQTKPTDRHDRIIFEKKVETNSLETWRKETAAQETEKHMQSRN